MSTQSGTNYAQLFGIHSTAAALVFAVLYAPLAVWFFVQLIRRPNLIFFFLHLFCVIRVAAFILRAILAASDSAAHNLSALITFEVFASAGFAGLLIPSYVLVLDRLLFFGKPEGIWALVRSMDLFRILLSFGIVIGIVGTVNITSSSSSTVSTGQTLRKPGLIVVFILTVLQAFQTLMLVKLENDKSATRQPQPREIPSFVHKHGHYLLLAIAIFLIIREAFTIATISDISKQNNEHFWYPLVAVPEFLAVICYAAPGLVPLRSELPK